MPEVQVTSPSGSKYKVTVPDGDENLPDFQERLKRQVTAYEQTYAQSGASAFGSGAVQGFVSVVAEPIRGVGELLGSEDLTSLGEEIAGTAKYNAPISPLMEDSWYAQGGQALGQGVGQLGLALTTGGAVNALGKGLSAAAKAKAVQAAVLGPAFFAGAAGGADESRRLGLEEGSAEDIANKLLYGGSELLSESIFGLGSKAFSKELVSDAPGVLLRGARTTAAGRAIKAIGQEALEEPIAGGLQDVSSRIAVEFGGQGDFLGSTTDNGAELRNPFDPKARLTEAALGAIGAGPFGVRAALSGDGSVNEVRDYRNRVNKARKAGSIKPKDQIEIDALDTKAKDFLELEGVPLMRNLGQSAVDGTAQGAVELNAIINDPAAAPATRAAAQVKLERFKEQGRKVVEQTDKFLAGDISLDDLRTSVSEYDNLNPYSAVNQEKQLAAAEAAQAAAPVAQVAQANAAAGNTATAAALIDTQAARQRATALRAQARADRKAPATQQPPAPVATPAPVQTAAQTAPNRRDQIVKRLAEIEAKLGPRDHVTIGANGQPDIVRPYRGLTLEEANLLKEVEALNATERAQARADRKAPTQTATSGVSIGNLDDLITGGGGTVQVVEGGQRVPFKQFGLVIDGDTAEVAYVEKELSSRAGVGYEAYVELGNQLAARGIKLRSSKAQYAPGRKVWTKLVTQGLARPIGQGAYEFVPAAVAPAQTPAPVASSREQAAREVEASYDEAVRTALPQVDTLVNESLPTLVNQVSQALADGDFETASTLADRVAREATRFQRFDAPEIQQAFSRALTPEQQEDFKRKRAAAEQLAKDVQRTVAARAKASGTPVGVAVAERMAPKPTQAEFSLDTPADEVASPLRVYIPEGASARKRDSLIDIIQELPLEVLDKLSAHGTDSLVAVEGLVKTGPIEGYEFYEGRLLPKEDGNPWGNTKVSAGFLVVSKLGQYVSSPGGIGAVVVRGADRNNPRTMQSFIEATQRLKGTGVPVITPAEFREWATSQAVAEAPAPATDEFGLPVEDAPVDEAVINEAFAELETPETTPVEAETPPASAVEPVVVNTPIAEGPPASMLSAKAFADKVANMSKSQYSAFVRFELYQDGRSDQELLSSFQYVTTKPEWYQDYDKARHMPHIEHLLRATDKGEPVSAEAVEDYGLTKYLAEYTSYKKAGKVYATVPQASEPVVSELDAIDAELAANKIKREQARQRARAARGRLGFFGGDPIEQAIADGRVWKANVELGYLLLKKGYVRFKIWAREYLRQNADDPASMRLLRRIYRMLRDDPTSAATLLNVPEDQIASLSGGMDASINNVSLAPEPQIKDPGYFGAIENVLDWAGNTTFFEGRESVPGGGKSHRIYLDEVIEGVTYDVVYRFEGKTYRTGDRVSRHGDEWLFGYGVGAGPRASRFRMYSTTLLTASFTGNNESTSRVAEDTRRNIIAFNQIAQFDASGRLAFNRSDEVARWISSVRYEKDDFRFPVNGDISDSEITVKLAGTEDVVGRFTLRDGVWVFGSGESLTKGEQTAQDSFAVVGFELEDSKGTTSADTPAKVVAAWPAKSKTYNPLDGFGPAPVNPEGKRVKAKTSEPAFKNYADLESWISAKRMRQGHSLDINKIRRYVRERGPRSFRKYVDKAMDAANKAYDAAYPAEQTSLPVFKARDNRNIGVQYARMVQDSAGARPLFTNNVFETAVQINMGLKVFVPEGFAGAVHPLIQVNPDTREVISASDASGKVSKAGDHLAVRQRDPNVLAKSEARMATEDEMNEALLDDFDFVDGLPKAADEDTMLAEARRKFASMRFSPSATKPFDRALVDLVATANLFAGNRLALLRPVIEETGYSKDGVVLDTAKLPAAIAAARAFIEARRQQAKTQRASLQDLGESTREVEDVSVLPDRLEDLVKAAAKSMVLRNNGGPINYGAYWNRALRRVMQRYNTRIQSGFAAPVATTQYNEEGSEQVDLNDEEQLAAALAAGDVGMAGSSLNFNDVVDEADEPEGGFVNPQKTSGRPVQLDLFGNETTEDAEPDTEDTTPVVEEDEPELTENNELGVALTAEVAAEPELTNEERFQISPEIAAKRNRGQRSTMRRILRDLPVHLKNAVFNSPTTDRFDVVLTSYYAMRSALIRSGVLRSEERPTFREALDLVFKNKDKVKGLDKLFSNSVKEALGQMSRAHAKAPGIPNARKAKAAADALGLVDGDPQSAIDALTRAASMPEIDFGTRMLLKRIAGLKGVSALRGFSMIPMETARGTMLRDRAIINISPSGSVTETAETLGHEFVHLSTEQAFQDLESGTADEAVVRADEELTVIREELASHAFRTMGAGFMVEYSQAFDNNAEFLAYLFSDSKFNAWVSARPQSFLIRVANAIRKLLGLKVPANTTMDKAWRALLLMSDRPAMFAQTAEAVSRDALELIIQSVDVFGPENEARNLMAGANARRLPEALKDSFSKARDMDAAGENKDKIRKETGWFKAPTDKQWRWEISDHEMTLDESKFSQLNEGEMVPLESLVTHAALFTAYPEARDIMIVKRSSIKSNGFMRAGPVGWMAPNGVMTVRTFTPSLVVHELQHWIQHKERFFTGSSPKRVKEMWSSGLLSTEDMSVALVEDDEGGDLYPQASFFQTYRDMPGEVEARLAARRAGLTDEQRAESLLSPQYPVTPLVLKLRNLAANGGVQAAYEAADTGIEVSTERDTPMWYDGSTDTIKMNPDVLAEETQFMAPKEAQEYVRRLVTHENIHRADNHTDTAQERDEYMNAMSESDFEWIASLYYVDTADREFALGRTPGMSADQKLEQRRILMREHRRAMIELALKGETTEQFAIFASSNPGLIDHIKRLLMRFVRSLTAQVRKLRYAGSARDLQAVMETLNNIEEISPSPSGGFVAGATPSGKEFSYYIVTELLGKDNFLWSSATEGRASDLVFLKNSNYPNNTVEETSPASRVIGGRLLFLQRDGTWDRARPATVKRDVPGGATESELGLLQSLIARLIDGTNPQLALEAFAFNGRARITTPFFKDLSARIVSENVSSFEKLKGILASAGIEVTTRKDYEAASPSATDKATRIAELRRRGAALKYQIEHLELPISSNYLFEDLASKLAIEGGNTPTEDDIQYWASEISMSLRQATRASDDPVRDVGGNLVPGKLGLTVLSNDDSVRRHTRKYSELYDRLKTRYPTELIKLSTELQEFETSGRGALAVQLARVQSELEDLTLGGEDFVAEARSVAVPIRSRRLGNYKVGGWATTGFLNQETAEQQRVRDAKLRAMQARVQMHKDDLAKAVKKEYTSQGLANPESLINEALGSIENPVAPQQLAVAEQLRTRAVRNAVSKFLGQQNLARSQSDPAQTALIRENARSVYQSELIQARKIKERYINKVESDWVTATKAKQAAAFATLSPETSTVVRAIRDDIDAMQQQLIQSGVLGPKTAARVTKTFGIYLTRSYQVYNENIVTVSGVKRNLWNEFLRDSKDPKSVAILDAARAAIFEDAVKEKAKELKLANTRARNPIGPFQSLADRDTAIKAAQRANPVLDSAEALRRARAMLVSNGGVEVETMLEKYLEMGENMDSDTDVLKRRDAIHPAIQALWGVYEQNEYNAFNTMMKINALLANQKLFEEIYKHGKAEGYIFDKEGVVVDGQRTVPLGGTGTQANRNRFGILAGKYGPAELKAGLEEAFGGNTQFTSSWWNFIRAATGYAMATKTKYSIQGTARNFVGNIMFAGINLNVHKLFDPRARGVVARQLGLKTKNKTEYDNYIRRLIELRVVSESAYEFRDLTREFSKEALGWVNRATKGRKFLSSAVEAVRKLDKFAGVAHQGADDFWKVLSFEGELGRVKAWEPNLTQEQAEEKAAWKIRHTMPTYTEAFYFIKRLRQQPFIAPFITFTAEIYRTTFGTVKVGLNEIAEGRANGNRTQMIAGLARISNLVAAIGFMPALMAMLGKVAFGAGEEDEEDGINPGAGEAALRRFVPEYMRNNSLMRFGSGKWDEQIYMDASYLIPHDVLGKVLRGAFDAYMKPETIGVAEKATDAVIAFMSQVLEPVTNEQLFFGSIMQAKFNYNQAYDRKIYKDTDTTWDATKAVIAHIYTSALEPGTVRTGRLIMEAADGVVRDGMKMEVGNEMLSVVGIKKRTIMLETRFARNAEEHKKLMGEAATYITSPLQSNSTVEDADIKRGYDRANEVRMDSLREARRDYLAATHLGMPQEKAKQLLLDSQLSDDEVALVVGNFYTPYQVSDQVFGKALEKSKAFGQDRVRLYLDAMKQYPKRQPLIPE